MIALHVLQADHGDCLLLEYGCERQPRYVLFDGGPSARIYDAYLKPALLKIREQGGKLDLVVLSHVDNDHVIGLLNYFTELRLTPDSDEQALPLPVGLWHNSFNQTVGQGENLEGQIAGLLARARAAGQTMQLAAVTIEGISQGHQLRLGALAAGIPINEGIPEGLVLLDTLPEPVQLGPLSVRVVGPGRSSLERLKKKWLEWLEENEARLRQGLPLAQVDQSIPNLSSIMFLAEAEGKRILLTGDGLGEDLLEGLEQAGLLDEQGNLHVDVLKIPHHGSARNVTRKFFKRLTADRYVISANGLHGNPDLATLIWIVDAARERGQQVEIVLTNETVTSSQLVQEYDPEEFGYTLTILAPEERSLRVAL